ncbi:MAG: DUF262 domain-containing protein [Chloroflexota bacterium]|nr:DUF262 domain-containing protein [Chloroflexota bacterium]
MKIPKIRVAEHKLSELMNDMKQGRIRIPRFQREFVWERTRINALLDSMYAEYPIGTIFLWNAPSEFNYLLRDDEELQQAPMQEGLGYIFILDGQQRLTSLYAVIYGLTLEDEIYNNFVVDLAACGDSPLFLYRYQGPDNHRWVSVNTLLSASHSFMLTLPKEYQPRFAEVADTLRNYPFSIVTVLDMGIEDAIEIFERINQRGRRLSRYDLICATVMSTDFDMRERTKTDIIEPLSAFGELEETSIPQALALNLKNSAEHTSQLGLRTEEVRQVWNDTVECFKLAVDFLVQMLGVARADFIPYPAMLPVLNHYFFRVSSKSIQSAEHRQQLEYWFWRVAFGERYSGASQTRMNEDARWIRQLLSYSEGCPEYPIATERRLLNARMSQASAIRNGLLCLLNTLGPLDFRSQQKVAIAGDHFSKFTLAERHHIFPVGYLKQQGFDARRVHAIANFCFIPSDTNKWIGDRAPSDYMCEIRKIYSSDEEFRAVMRTHLIPAGNDSGIWTNDYEQFLRQRIDLLLREIGVRCGVRIAVQEEQRDPVVNAIELSLRDTIHHTMLARDSDYWKRFVPGDVKNQVEARIDQQLRKTPGLHKSQFDSSRKKLEFCDVSDYAKIIVNGRNWQLFSGVFKNKQECQRVLDDFREFRTALKHNREIGTMLDFRAQAAILWLRDALGLDLSEFGM